MTGATHTRRMRRIRKAVTEALNWHEIGAFAGGGDPDHVGWKRARAAKARATLERIIEEELNNAHK